MNLEERILNIAEAPAWYDSRELRAIALDVRKMEERIKRLEEYGHQLFLWLDRNTPVTVRNDWIKAKEAKP